MGHGQSIAGLYLVLQPKSASLKAGTMDRGAYCPFFILFLFFFFFFFFFFFNMAIILV